jgi:hypothetical protein
VLRIVGLGHCPPPLNQDEASRGYDAWCLLETGADRHGRQWPFFLESFGPGDFTAALSTYLTIPFVVVMGPTPEAIRLPNAIFGVLTVLLIYDFLRRTVAPSAGIIGAAILATDPWHVTLSRTGHESGLAPFFLMLTAWAAWRTGWFESTTTPDGQSPRRLSAGWAVVSAAAAAFCAWAYPATRLIVPLWLIAAIWMFRHSLRRAWRLPAGRRALVVAALSLVAAGVPLWWTAMTHPDRLAARAGVSVFHESSMTDPRAWIRVVKYFFWNFDPRYAFLRGEDMSGASLPDTGMHLAATAPLLAIGLAVILPMARRGGGYRFLLVSWALAWLPASICADWNPHPMRTAAALPLFPIMCAIGAARGISWLDRRKRSVATLVVGASVLALALNAGVFARRYFSEFPSSARRGYQTDLFEAMQIVAAHVDEADFVLVTNYVNQPYIYALLAVPIEPARYRDLPKCVVENRLGFHHVLRVGKFLFAPTGTEAADDALSSFQSALAELVAPRRVGLVVEWAGRFGDGTVIGQTKAAADGQTLDYLEVRRWRVPERPAHQSMLGPGNALPGPKTRRTE